ncbi:MAG TPA: hypothetical protein VFG43_01465, partial [Geminicoccaceae bacterium]|nr:hypothetical protein [Geminicoccaceae bacterium]
GGRGLLVIADDGIGLGSAGGNAARGEGATESETLGLTLCRMLAKQIGGQLNVSGPPGTEVSVSFNLP